MEGPDVSPSATSESIADAAIAHFRKYVVLDFRKFEASFKRYEPMPPSPRELKILKYLIEYRGEVVSRAAPGPSGPATLTAATPW